PALRRPHGIRALIGLQAVAVVSVLTLGVVGMAFPALVPPVPAPGSPVAIAGLAAGTFFYAILLLRALKTYLLTHRVPDVAVVVVVTWPRAAVAAGRILIAAEVRR